MNTEQLHWFKASHSSGGGGERVELSYAWRKSSYSGGEGGECIEIAAHPTTIHIRDSKNPQGPQLAVAPRAWAAFTAYATQ
ncbi:DUF397 domain-containing protein [Streptomyces sp. NPDC001691]|uniref:DUF397 domain-containing protein n=1 Tax=unclassified Streptomyces TaxID=2593676 RepID=UPI000DEB4974|nr:DUF397 domain-containing protein [Streptomyces sp. SDr-06]RCH64802.1 DUF397 domain-containing protein [Streptomyces sp. SDr-06]